MVYLKTKGYKARHLEDGLADLAEYLRGDNAGDFKVNCSIFLLNISHREGFFTGQPPPKRGAPPRREASPAKPTVTLSPSTMTGT